MCGGDKGYHVLLLQVVEEFLQGGVASQGGDGAQHQQLVFGSGDGHVQPAPVLKKLPQLTRAHTHKDTHTHSTMARDISLPLTHLKTQVRHKATFQL